MSRLWPIPITNHSSLIRGGWFARNLFTRNVIFWNLRSPRKYMLEKNMLEKAKLEMLENFGENRKSLPGTKYITFSYNRSLYSSFYLSSFSHSSISFWEMLEKYLLELEKNEIFSGSISHKLAKFTFSYNESLYSSKYFRALFLLSKW